MSHNPQLGEFLARLLASSMKDRESDEKEFDGTPATVTLAMCESCPLTKTISRRCDLSLDMPTTFGARALPVFHKTLPIVVKITRGVALCVNTTSYFKDGTALWLNFVSGRLDAPNWAMSKYQLMEAEDEAAEKFVEECLSLFMSPEWAEAVKLCGLVGVLREYCKTVAWAKIGSGRPTIRIVRGTPAEAVQALLQELITLGALDSKMVYAALAARLQVHARVARLEVERRAETTGAADDVKKEDAARVDSLIEECD